MRRDHIAVVISVRRDGSCIMLDVHETEGTLHKTPLRMIAPARKNVFVLGFDEQHRADLNAIPDADRFRFFPLLHADELVYQEHYDIDAKLDEARRILRESGVSPDAIICHWDFPAASMHAILCAEIGLPGPSLEASLRCSHKYWSRLEQRAAVPESTPQFCAFDPFHEDALAGISVDFPFWIKPVKGYGSTLGYRISDASQFQAAMAEVRQKIDRLGKGIDAILHHVHLPAEVARVRGNWMIAEAFLQGYEFAPEGYVQNGEYHSHGMVDMVRARNHKSFLRYEYPSRAPNRIQQRANELASRLLAHLGFDNACFNMEFFWDQESDRLWIIEINPRISQSHSNLFEKVDGMSNHEVAVHVALGDRPHFEHGAGKYEHAAKYLFRRFEKADAVATRVPGPEDLARLSRAQPDTQVTIKLEEGMRLSELLDEDAYSYVLAELMIGADSVHELNRKYEEATRLLPFAFRSVG
jgi:biotin carboxylase